MLHFGALLLDSLTHTHTHIHTARPHPISIYHRSSLCCPAAQVATDYRLWLTGQIKIIREALQELIIVSTDRSAAEVDILMPGFTHLQPAMTVRWDPSGGIGSVGPALCHQTELAMASFCLSFVLLPLMLARGQVEPLDHVPHLGAAKGRHAPARSDAPGGHAASRFRLERGGCRLGARR